MHTRYPSSWYSWMNLMTDVLEKVKSETLSFLVLTIETTSPKPLGAYINSLGKNDSQFAILDLSYIKTLESPAWFRNIRSLLKQQNISLLGIRSPQLNLEICKSLKIPVIDESSILPPLTQSTSDQYIESPVRTGQQRFAQNGNLVVHGHVSSGAELAAKNNIYIYGSANGKFIAGANGEKNARIYLLSGYPELLSIAGITLHADALSPITKPCYFWINNGQLTQSTL